MPDKYLVKSATERGIRTDIYQAVALHECFAQLLNVVAIVKANLQTQAQAHVTLFSSDLDLAYDLLINCYSSRVQIEISASKTATILPYYQDPAQAQLSTALLRSLNSSNSPNTCTARRRQCSWQVPLPVLFGNIAGRWYHPAVRLIPDGRQRGWPADSPATLPGRSARNGASSPSLAVSATTHGIQPNLAFLRLDRANALTPMSDIAIRVDNLSKLYHLGAVHQRPDTLRDALTGLFRRGHQSTCPQSTNHDDLWALKEGSFEVKRGEVMGTPALASGASVIGRNGAGKSTLLMILSRITEPLSAGGEAHKRVGLGVATVSSMTTAILLFDQVRHVRHRRIQE